MTNYQTLLTNLIYTKSKTLGLPITLFTFSGQMIESTSTTHERMFFIFNEMKSIAKQISKVTIFTSMDSQETPTRYFLSPVVSLGEETFFWVAEIENDELEDKHLVNLNEMTDFISMFVKEESEQRGKDSLIALFTELHRRDVFGNPMDEHFPIIGELLLNSGALDFIGFASRTEEHSFAIRFALGEKTDVLINKSFYIGEGALGHAVAAEHHVFWENIRNTNRASVLNRYGIHPNHLFCFPLKVKGHVDHLLFLGSNLDRQVNKEFLKNISFLMTIFEEACEKNKVLNEAQAYVNFSRAMMEFLDVCIKTSDFRNVIFKMLDVMQVVSNGLLSCFSYSEGFYLRGPIKKEIEELHKRKWEDTRGLLNDRSSSFDGGIIQQCFYANGQPYGLLTVELQDLTHVDMTLEFMQAIVNTAGMAYQRLVTQKVVTPEAVSIYDTLHDALKELKPTDYQLTVRAKDILEEMTRSLNITNEKILVILQASKLISYGVPFLEKNIPDTKELSLIKEYTFFLEGSVKQLSDEASLLVIVFSELKGTSFNQTVLKPEFLSLFSHFSPNYKDKKTPVDLQEKKLPISVTQSESISDIRDVIKELNLTSREKEVLHLVLEGLNNIEVGDYLKISIHTVKNHITNIYRKLNVTDRVQAMAKIYRIKFRED